MIGGLSINDRMKGVERFTEECCKTRAILRKLLPYIVLAFLTRVSVETGRGDAHAFSEIMTTVISALFSRSAGEIPAMAGAQWDRLPVLADLPSLGSGPLRSFTPIHLVAGYTNVIEVPASLEQGIGVFGFGCLEDRFASVH